MNLRILYEDAHLVAVDKPAGLHSVPPEDPRIRVSQTCMKNLRNQLGHWVYPIHRLDRATSGILLFAKSSEAARGYAELFQRREITKSYIAAVRGWTPDEGLWDSPLRKDDRPEYVEARTHYRTLVKTELPHPVGRYATARYSLLEIQPETGRRNQIRRHSNRASHPILGDSHYGDRQHNLFLKQTLLMQGMFLNAHEVRFVHPESGGPIIIRSQWTHRWHQLFELFGYCPWNSGFVRDREKVPAPTLPSESTEQDSPLPHNPWQGVAQQRA